MMVTLQEALNMTEANDAEVMGEYIVVECDDGFWYAKSNQPKCDDIDDVKWYVAQEWMRMRFARLQGKGLGHVNDQIRDVEIKRYMEEFAQVKDDRGFDFNEAMPGSSSDEYADVQFDGRW